MIVERLLGGENAQPLARPAHCAGQEKTVDPLGMLEGLAQPATGLEVETQRQIAELEIEIEHSGALLMFLAETPADSGRDRCRADAAATAAWALARRTVWCLAAALLGQREDRNR